MNLNWRWMSAAILGWTLGLYAGYWLTTAQVPEGAWGYDVPPVVRMSGEPRSYTLIPGGCTLEAAAHEIADGFVNCSTLTISAPRASVTADILRSLIGSEVEIVVRLREPRQLETVSR